MPPIGVITFELRLDDAHSLKDKRHYVKSLKDRLRAKFNVAVAEIDHQDLWQRGLVACVTVSPDQAFAEQVLQAWSARRRHCWADAGGRDDGVAGVSLRREQAQRKSPRWRRSRGRRWRWCSRLLAKAAR